VDLSIIGKSSSLNGHLFLNWREVLVAKPKLKSRGPTYNIKDQSGLDKLKQEAANDPKLFHNLIFKTEDTVKRLKYLSDDAKAAIIRVRPEDLASGIAGRIDPGDVEVCGASCGASCGGSCAASCAGSCGGSCGGSCENSCAATCGGSCGASCGNSCAGSCVTSCVVSGDRGFNADIVTLPAEQLTADIQSLLKAQSVQINFSRFQR
jgi:hypothetical protein